MKNKEQIENLSLKLMNRRLELKMSQEELAFRIGSHVNSIVNIERGMVDPALSKIISLANALEMNVKDLLPD